MDDPMSLLDVAQVNRYRAEADPDRKKTLRNDIVDERILEIDHQFNEFSLDLWRSETGSSVGVDWVQLALSGATAVIGGVAVKAALGAASTGLAGARASFDKNVLFSKTLAALMAQMVAERQRILADIETSKGLPASDYSLFAALSDLQRLVVAGSIPGTLQVIAQDAGVKSINAQAQMQSVRSSRFLEDAAGIRLRAFWKPDGKTINTANEVKLKRWIVANNNLTILPTVSYFLKSTETSALRARAMTDLLGK